jgi:hypothetical protein
MRGAYMKGNSAAAGDLRGVGPDLPKLCLQTVTDEDAEQSGWLKAQLRVFEVYVDGRMPTEWKTVFDGGRLVPLVRPKEPNKLRVAVVPMVMTRAFGRLALWCVKEEMARTLRGAGQVGVGVSGACEAVVRTVQALAEEVERDEEKSCVIVQDDLKNFYNEVSQLAIRDVIMQRVPALARLAKYLCEGPDHATVFYGLFHPMVKSVGVHMGSTLAAAFSAVVLAHHVEEWQRRWAESRRARVRCATSFAGWARSRRTERRKARRTILSASSCSRRRTAQGWNARQGRVRRSPQRARLRWRASSSAPGLGRKRQARRALLGRMCISSLRREITAAYMRGT